MKSILTQSSEISKLMESGENIKVNINGGVWLYIIIINKECFAYFSIFMQNRLLPRLKPLNRKIGRIINSPS